MNKSLKLNRQFLTPILILAIFGCGSDSATKTESADATAESTSSIAPTPLEQTTASRANFTAQLIGGGNFDSTAMLATKPLAFWFWAPG